MVAVGLVFCVFFVCVLFLRLFGFLFACSSLCFLHALALSLTGA